MPRNFLKVSGQVALALQEEIVKRTWVDRLPGEQMLAAKFQVSRKTIRAALNELRSNGIIQTRNGVGSQIVTRTLPRRKSAELVRIGLLLPEALEAARQHTLLWVNHLMKGLQSCGYQLEIFHGRKYFGQSSSRSLQTLSRSNPMACWILARSTPAMQEWFIDTRTPVMVAGSTHRNVVLPSVDIDHFALCQHAAGVLLRNGHRNMALLFDRAGHAGDIESEAGFLQSCTTIAPGNFRTHILKIELTQESVIKELKRLMHLAEPPTAFLLSNSFSYLSAGSFLTSIGKLIPKHVSLISRDEETFLQYLHPIPARYYCPPKKFAAAVFHAVEGVLQKPSSFFIRTRIMPDFLPGGSVGNIRPPARG